MAGATTHPVEAAVSPVPARRRGWGRQALRDRNPYVHGLLSGRGIAGLAVIAVLLLAAVLGPLLLSHSPTFQQRNAMLLGPSGQHPLGTDDLGRDVLARVLTGIRVDFVIGLIGVPCAAVAGTALALFGSLSRGLDTALQRIFDVLLAFPSLVLAIAITAVLGTGEQAIVVAVVLSDIPTFGRLIRGSVLVLRDREYVVAARLGGTRPARLLLRHILPNAADPLIVQFSLSMSTAVLLEGGLSFVGIGIQIPEPSLGNMLGESLPYLSTNATFALGPLIGISALVIGFNLIADSLNAGVRR
jgi:peptide/nickel transport system permease protein